MTIIPDDKDWTWVLRQVCPECSFDASQITRDHLPAIVRGFGESWRAVLGRPDVRRRPSDDVWSPLEYGCHVRDVLRLADFRVGLMLDEDAPRFANWDQDQTAIDERYGEQDPAVVRDEVAAAAEAFAGRLESVTGAQWPRTGLRSDGAEFTVESFGRYLVHDPIHHLRDVGGVAADG